MGGGKIEVGRRGTKNSTRYKIDGRRRKTINSGGFE